MSEQNTPHVILTTRFFEAVEYASKAHESQVRKSTNIAYIAHPLGVAALVIEALGDEDQVIAGLLHDVAEDCGGENQITTITNKFGPRVANIVRACSDSLTETEEEKAPWKERKIHHIAKLANASDGTLIVTAADKLHKELHIEKRER